MDWMAWTLPTALFFVAIASALALMVAGLVGIGAATRRRRKHL